MGEASGARAVFGRGPGFWYYPSRLEESSGEDDENEEEWIDFSQHWDVSSEDSDPPYNFCGFKSSFLYEGALPTHPLPSALQVKMHRLPAPWRHQLTAEEAERNARELVAEEERMKRKAEKKKLKKKKQKDRKKREKLGQELKSKKEAELSTSSLSSPAGAEHPQNSNAEEQEGWPGPSRSPCLGGSTASSGEERGGQEAKAEEMEDELDLSCTFVFKARQKAGVRLPVPGKEKPARTDNAEPGRRALGREPKASLPCLPTPQEPKASLPCLPTPQEPKASLPCLPALQAPKPETVPLDTSMVEQSLIIAGRGNEAAQKGRYAEAVQAFTEAVKLNPREHRLFGNRSYCYEKLQRYEEALRDAQVSLGLQPGWPKGFFRKGKALRGLKRYAEAISTFEELLRLDGANADAAVQLEACRALLRVSPGSGIPGIPSCCTAGPDLVSPHSRTARAARGGSPCPRPCWRLGSHRCLLAVRDLGAGSGFALELLAELAATGCGGTWVVVSGLEKVLGGCWGHAGLRSQLSPSLLLSRGVGERELLGHGHGWLRDRRELQEPGERPEPGRGQQPADAASDPSRQGLLSPLGGEHHCQDQREGAAQLLQPVWADPLHPDAARATLRLHQLHAEEGGGSSLCHHAGCRGGGKQAGTAAQAPLPRHPVPPAAPRAPRQGVAGGVSSAYGSGPGPCLGLPALPAPAPGRPGT